MNEDAKKRFDELLDRNVDELTEEEVDFLRARRTYIRKDQLGQYEEVFAESEDRQASHAKEAPSTKEENVFPAELSGVSIDDMDKDQLKKMARYLGLTGSKYISLYKDVEKLRSAVAQEWATQPR
jgi:hypothetical protein